MSTIASLIVKIGANNADLEKGLAKTQKFAMDVGKNLTKYISVPLAGAGVAATKMAMDFEKELANVNTLLGGNSARIAEFKGGIQDLSIAAGKRTSDLTGGMYQVISAFGDSEHSMYLLETAAKAGAAGLSTTESSINLLSAVIKGYNLDVTEAGKVSDYAFKTVKLGQTTFDELAGSMGKVIPLASAMNLGQQELWGTMATLTGVTGSTAEVTTQLRATLQGLMKPTKDMQMALKNIGYDSGSTAIKTLGLEGTLQALYKTTGNNNESFANLWGQIEAGTAVLALTGAQAETWNEKIGAMGDVTGETEQAFGILTETSAFLWDQLKQTGIVILQELGDAILEVAVPVAQELLPQIRDLVKWFRDLDPSVQKNIVKFGLFLAAVGPVVIALSPLIGLLKGIVGFFAIIGGAGAGSAAFAGAGLTGLLYPLALVTAAWLGLKTAVKQTTGELIDYGHVKDLVSQGVITPGVGKYIEDTKGRGIPMSWQDTAWDGKTLAPAEIFHATQNATSINTQPAFRAWDNSALRGYDTGGVVPGPLGAPRIVMAHGGETYIPTHKPGFSLENMIQEHKHSGTITVRGVNSRDELVAVVPAIVEATIKKDDRRIPNRTSLYSMA